MLVNAHAYPYAAMFQGVGIILAVVWGIWYTSRPSDPRKQTERQKEAIKRLLIADEEFQREVLKKMLKRAE